MTTPHDSPRYFEAWSGARAVADAMTKNGVPRTVVACALLETVLGLVDREPMLSRAAQDEIAIATYRLADMLAAPESEAG